MSEDSAYTSYHPRWYRTRMSTFWWVKRRSYFTFVLRELSSVFVAWFVVFLLMLVHAVGEGSDRYRQFLAWSAHPWVIALNLVALVFVAFHGVTWFNLAPQAMVVHVRGARVPPRWLAVSNYLGWALVSVLVAWLVLGG